MEFNAANAAHETHLREVKASSQGNIMHYKRINPEDLTKLLDSFEISVEELFNRCHFYVRVYLSRRGNQGIDTMKTNMFQIKTAPEGFR